MIKVLNVRLEWAAVISLSAACLGAGVAEAQEATPVAAAPAEVANRSGRVYPPRVYTAARLQGPSPAIDGRLDDDAWREGEWSGDYRQQIPVEGAAPSQRTELKILYDEKNVYVAIRAYDDPARMHRWPSRRDEMIGDIVGVCFDSDSDKRSGFEFDLTAGGGKIDLILGNGETEWDANWDAVWHGAVGLEPDAWTAEIQVPLSQLRYGPQHEQVWGLHAWRWIDRNQEEVQWQLIPRRNTGRMHQLGELRGIRGLGRQRRVELLPYALGRVARGPSAEGATGRSGALGLDAKVGLTSNFTLDATVNPDFGQVEADPSVMNLTAYETFFDEKRPFFLEGKSIASFAVLDSDTLFYSRRIGHAPSLSPSLGPGETVRLPESTTILGALKVTGKTAAGLSLGLIQSLTQREAARVAAPGGSREETVEPWGSYTVARVHQDWDKGNTSLGGMLTYTRRGIEESTSPFLPESALAGGIDFARYFADRSWVIEASAVASRVSGDPRAIQALQTNAVHYYQRPDAPHVDFDPLATALSGHGGFLRVGRTDKGRLRLSNRFNWYSPGLELNDLGYLRQADVLANRAFLGWSEPSPKGPFRSYSAQLSRSDQWDFGGLKTWGSTELDLSGQFRNKWSANAGLRWIEEPVDTRVLRGGPALRQDSFLCTSLYLESDGSRRLGGSASSHAHLHSEGVSLQTDSSASLWLRPLRAMRVSANVSYSTNRDDLQYVSSPALGDAQRFVLGRISQRTWSLTVRANLTLSPNLSLQYYGSPFVSTGRYGGFKRATDTQASRYPDRFHAFAGDELRYRADGNAYDATGTEGGYSFGNPDFSFREFRSNLVLRWEYRPGSSLYVVWSQGRTDLAPAWESRLGSNWNALWRARPDNVLLVKLSYWFSP